MNNIQEQLHNWATSTFNDYNCIAKREKKYAFYNQSNLSNIISEVSLCIIGINPNSICDYSSQCNNPNWTYLHNNKGTEHILYGNYCRDLNKPNSKSSWENRKKWNYWRGLKTILSQTYDSQILDNESDYIITNASFFCTKKAIELPDNLLKETLPHTIELINITNPKHIIFLGGKACFKKLSEICSEKEFTFMNVLENIYVGKLYNRTVFGIPHPAYKTNEELILVSKVLSFIYDKEYEEINPQETHNACLQELESYYQRVKHNKNNIIINSKKIETEVLDRFSNYKYDNNRRVRFSNNATYGITIAEGCIEVRQAFEGKYKTAQNLPTDSIVIKLLGTRGYAKDKNWLGRKKLQDFGKTDEEIIERVCVEVNVLFSLLQNVK